MPEQHTGTTQPPAVLICFDCCSLIIEDNKVRTFLSCRVCCLSLWPRLSEAGVPLDQLSTFSGPRMTGDDTDCSLHRIRCSEITLPSFLYYICVLWGITNTEARASVEWINTAFYTPTFIIWHIHTHAHTKGKIPKALWLNQREIFDMFVDLKGILTMTLNPP